MNLHQCIFTENDCYKTGRTIRPKGIMVHSTGANNPNLRRYVQPNDGLLGENYYENHWNRSGVSVCVHAFIGKLADDTIATYQTLPWNHRGWHAGKGKNGSANNMYIAFEICEDKLTDAVYFQEVYREAVELAAYLCKLYSLNPLEDGVIICHNEGFHRGIASGHMDVLHWFPIFNKTMDDFRADVAVEMEDQMTKEDVLDIIKEYEEAKAAEEPSDWSKEARTWAEDNGIIAGDGSDNMKYKSACTREQIVVILYRMFKLIRSLFGGGNKGQ